MPKSNIDRSLQTRSSVPWIHVIGMLAVLVAMAEVLKCLGDIVLSTPRSPGAVVGQFSDAVLSPG